MGSTEYFWSKEVVCGIYTKQRVPTLIVTKGDVTQCNSVSHFSVFGATMELTDEKAAVTDLCGISCLLALDFSLDSMTLKVFNIAIFITAPIFSLPFL